MTFDECAAAYAKAHGPKWTAKHAMQWGVSLAKHASPVFGKLPVQAVDTALVVKALETIWHDKPETASRTRQRIEAVLDWATVRGYRTGENPARWNGYLQKLLPSRRELLPTEHFAALPYRDVPDLIATLREHSGDQRARARISDTDGEPQRGGARGAVGVKSTPPPRSGPIPGEPHEIRQAA